MEITLTVDEFARLREEVQEYRRLKDEETSQGVASWDLLDMEDTFGNYLWVIERIVDTGRP